MVAVLSKPEEQSKSVESGFFRGHILIVPDYYAMVSVRSRHPSFKVAFPYQFDSSILPRLRSNHRFKVTYDYDYLIGLSMP